MGTTSLKEEIEYFNSKLPDWLDTYEDQFALIKDHQLIGTFSTEVEAYKEGIARLGNVPFLIKQISRVEIIQKLPALMVGLIHAHP
jgi:hypothetical protein